MKRLSLKKLVKKFGQYKEVPSHDDEIRFCCPYCVQIGKPPDTKFHLYINLTKGVGYCFRCGKILKFDKNFKVEHSFYIDGISLPKPVKGSSLDKIPESIPIFDSIGYQFLLNKLEKIYSKDYIDKFIQEYEISFCIDKSFPHLYQRIMIPVKVENELVGFQFRAIFGEEPKYYTYNYKNRNMKDYVFNYDRVKNSNEVFLCEGIFDILPFPEKAVACFGKNLTKQQKRLIRNTWQKIYICLDADAIDDAYKLAYDLMKEGIMDIGIVELPEDKDPCEIGKEIYNLPIRYVSIADFLQENKNELEALL